MAKNTWEEEGRIGALGPGFTGFDNSENALFPSTGTPDFQIKDFSPFSYFSPVALRNINRN